MRRIAAASLGKMPTTLERRLISLLSRSSGLFDQILRQCSRGNDGEREHVAAGVAQRVGGLREPRRARVSVTSS